jgi:hypothetical protein
MHPILLVALIVVAQVSPTVTVSTDRGWYSPGEQVIVRVSTTDFASTERFWLSIDKPDGHNLYFTELPVCGDTIAVTLPKDAPDGTYTVTVTWDHRYVETGFIVESQPVPEFPFSFLVLILALAVASTAVSRRKASASAETVAFDPRAHVLCRSVRWCRCASPEQASESHGSLQ